jgi:hypothetical protein
MTTSAREVAAMPRSSWRPERRDTSPAGEWNRDKFEASLGLLHALGLSLPSIEYYRRRARETQQLPHEIVALIIEETVRRADP